MRHARLHWQRSQYSETQKGNKAKQNGSFTGPMRRASEPFQFKRCAKVTKSLTESAGANSHHGKFQFTTGGRHG
ncbi:MAG: hypothetical protein AAFR74_04060, partial [Pseudomonadota bacterium]